MACSPELGGCERQRRLVAVFALLLGVACGDPAEDASLGDGASGSAASSGSAGVGGGAVSAGGTSSVGGVPVTLAGSGQALGGGDQGSSFSEPQWVPITPPEMVGGSGGSGGGIPGDGNVFTSKLSGGDKNGTAKFTQKGEDVELELELTRCPDGKHRVSIHGGFSCDNATTKGPVWERSGEIGGADGVVCSGGKGSLKYTRSGADKSKNWTVGDHVVETDLTAHVVIIGKVSDPNSLDCCGNFF